MLVRDADKDSLRRQTRFWKAAVLGTLAVVCAVLVPVIHGVGLAYGASWLEWDPVHASNYYAERPGGFVVLVCAWLVTIVLAGTAIVLMVLAIVALTRPHQRRNRT